MILSGAPKNRIIGSKNNCVMHNNRHPNTTIPVMAFPIQCTASSSFPLPFARLNADAPPIPNSRAMEIQAVLKGNAMFVAAFPSAPTLFPMKN